jgi:hypothetical protein
VPNKLGNLLQGLRRSGHKRDDLLKIDPWSVRSHSLSKAEGLGYAVNPTLPLLDRPESERPVDEIFQRALCLFVTSACAYGIDREKGEIWLQKEGAHDALSPNECEYLRSGAGDIKRFTGGVEALWAVMWALGLVRRLDFADNGDDDFVSMFPSVTTGETSEKLRSRVRLRPVSQMFQQLDLAYCLHSAIVDAKLKGLRTPGDVHPAVIEHRRKALQWLVGHEDWDDVAMDT